MYCFCICIELYIESVPTPETLAYPSFLTYKKIKNKKQINVQQGS